LELIEGKVEREFLESVTEIKKDSYYLEQKPIKAKSIKYALNPSS
jgi:hypothetical protein